MRFTSLAFFNISYAVNTCQTRLVQMHSVHFFSPCDIRHRDSSCYCSHAQNHMQQPCRICLCSWHVLCAPLLSATISKNVLFYSTIAYTPRQSCVWIFPNVALLGALHVNMCALLDMPACCMNHCRVVQPSCSHTCRYISGVMSKAADADVVHV